MKQAIFILFFTVFSLNLTAQKEVRKEIRVGNKAYKEQLYNAAESSYKSAIAKNPNAKEAIYNLANSYYKQGRWDDALKEYQHYLTLENENGSKKGDAWHNVGNVLLKKKDLQKSMDAYKEALRMNPLDEQSRYNLAVVQKIIKDQQDNNKDNKQDKDDKKQDQEKDKNKDKQENQDKKPDQKKDQKPEENKDEQMSESNARQMLQAIEQDEKETQERVKQMKAAEKQKQNENNKKLNKDW